MIYEIIFLMLPLLLSGITLIFGLKSKHSHIMTFPLDFNLTFRGKRIFGKNKMLRGPVFMALFTALYGFIIYHLLKSPFSITPSNGELLIKYALVGMSYSIGELPNSFIKRQFDVAPGRLYPQGPLRLFFRFLDTFDSLITVSIAYILLFKVNTNILITAILIGGAMHLLTDQLMRLLGLKKLH